MFNHELRKKERGKAKNMVNEKRKKETRACEEEKCYFDQQFLNDIIINPQFIRVPHRALYNLAPTYVLGPTELLLHIHPGTPMVHLPCNNLAHADPSVSYTPLLLLRRVNYYFSNPRPILMFSVKTFASYLSHLQRQLCSFLQASRALGVHL